MSMEWVRPASRDADMTDEDLEMMLGGHRLIRFLFAFSLGCVTGVFWREVFRLVTRWL